MRLLPFVSILGLTTLSNMACALPFMPVDARGLAMGNTGVATSRLAHAPAYNPALLTEAQDDDDFAILFPQAGVILSDEGAIIKKGRSIRNETVPKFDKLFESGNPNNFRASLEGMKTASGELVTAIDNVKTASSPAEITARKNELSAKNSNFRNSITKLREQIKTTNNITNELNQKLNSISNNPLQARAGVATAFAFPSKKLAFAFSVRNDTHLSAQVFVTKKDQNLLASYGKAVDGYTKGAYALPNSVDGIINKLEAGSVPSTSELNTLKTSAESTQSYSSPLVNTANGNIRILENGKLSTPGQNPQFNSKAQFVGMNILELGLSAARVFEIEGRKVSFGLTPKVISVETFHYGTSMQNKKSGSIDQARTSYLGGNIDLGASYRFGEQSGWLAAVSLKNLIPQSYKTSSTTIKDKNGIAIETLEGPTLKVSPQLRAAGSYENSWFVGTAELDITENAPVAFESATRYLAFGAEFDLFDSAQFRTGLRTNLSGDDLAEQSVISFGIGLSPSIVETNLTFMANPSAFGKISDLQGEFGAAFELGLAF